MILLYTASGLFHGLRYTEHPEWRPIFQKIDKSAIFLLISGSYVPVFAYMMHGAWRVCCLVAMLGTAVAGIALMWLVPNLRHEWLVAIYSGMGVVGLVTVPKIIATHGARGIGWIGGVAGFYLLGAAIEVLKWPVPVPGWVGPHELLHVADMGGSFCMFVFVVRYVIPRYSPRCGAGRRIGRSGGILVDYGSIAGPQSR
jgi:hemolysin III